MSRWQPVLDGELANAAWRTIGVIASDLAGGTAVRPGDAALFWAYLGGVLDEPWIDNQLETATRELVASIARGGAAPRLFGGLAGDAFVLAHVTGEGVAEDLLREVDAALAAELAADSWRGSFDLIDGLVGIGVYFLERGATAPLVRILDHLEATTHRDDLGATWQTPIDPDRGAFNCGLAHGTPGMIALLGRIATATADPRAPALCTDAMRWLGAQRLAGGWFPCVAGSREPAPPAWCYGSPGIAIAGFDAAVRIGTPADPWTALMQECADQHLDLASACFCHGTAGLAHMFNRFFQATHDERYRGAARRWYAATLGCAGSLAEANLLEGSVGVALALLAGVHPVAPAWDRLVMCELPNEPA